MKRLRVFILPPGWDAIPSQGYPQHYAGTYLYTWVERGTARVKCLAQEHNTMSPPRPRTRTTPSGVKRTDHETTAPPELKYNAVKIMNQPIDSIHPNHSWSHKTLTKCRAPVAQLVEHQAVTREIVSSTPAGPTLRVFK